jgi:N-acetylglutamate synthase-like GNAT family acetyltransferase
MNTQLVEQQVAATTARSRSRRVQSARPSTQIVYRAATPGEAPAIHALITRHLADGRLLPREVAELAVHAHRFVVAIRRGRIVGCAELAPLSGRVAEVRSLVVDRTARSLGIGQRMIEELQRRARLEGFEQLCAFAHDAAYFVRKGFSIVPHTWVPEKIARDCTSCAQFRRCGQHALVQSLRSSHRPRVETFVPLSALRG